MDSQPKQLVVLHSEQRCSNPARHTPVPRLLVLHHSIPQSWGGTQADTLVCSNCHMSTHVLIDAYVKAKGDPGWTIRERFDPYIRTLALRAWANRPEHPTPTL